jgi:MbtH protein
MNARRPLRIRALQTRTGEDSMPGTSSDTNPFDDDNGTYLVLANAENQHSLWPAAIAVPEGWTVVHDSDTRNACVEYVEEHWTDMRPASLVAAMAEDEKMEGSR